MRDVLSVKQFFKRKEVKLVKSLDMSYAIEEERSVYNVLRKTNIECAGCSVYVDGGEEVVRMFETAFTRMEELAYSSDAIRLQAIGKVEDMKRKVGV